MYVSFVIQAKMQIVENTKTFAWNWQKKDAAWKTENIWSNPKMKPLILHLKPQGRTQEFCNFSIHGYAVCKLTEVFLKKMFMLH